MVLATNVASRRARPVGFGLGIVSVMLLQVGCGSGRPKAPALSDAPIYQNRREGFKFLVPDGWVQSASSVLPKGKLEGETLLVQYKIRSPEPGAYLEILCFDAPAGKDLHKYHAGESHGSRSWNSIADAEQIEVSGTKGDRFAYKATVSNKSMTKEVVVFRKGDRVYSFIGLFWSTDTKAQQQIRRAVTSTIWKG